MRRCCLLLLPAVMAAAWLPQGCASVPGPAATPGGAVITGRVTLGESPLPGVRVGAWERPDFALAAPSVATKTDPAGYYRLESGPGTWYLAVADPAGGYFGYSGLNPLRLERGGQAEVGFRAGPAPRETYRPLAPGRTAVEGRLTADGLPLPGGRVFLYLDAAEDFRGPGFAFSPPADAEGGFLIEDVPPGTYYLVGRRRADDRLVGPIESGDHFGYFPWNPVEVRDGQALVAELPCTVKKKELFPSAGPTVLEGTVRDAQGRPTAGVYVFAYVDEVVGHQKPAATSAPTGPDGRYRLTLPSGGIYYVGAREKYGTNPQPGERYGLYPGSPDHSVRVEGGGRLEGLDLVVEEVLGWE